MLFSSQCMVLCFQNCSDLLWEKIVPVVEKKILKFEAEGREFAKHFEITRTICLNSERSELVPGCFSDIVYYNN